MTIIFNDENSGSLNHVLDLIALQVHAPADELKAYAAEDNLGGYHWNEALRLWPMGSMFGVEGQIIYALIRYFKPGMIAEIGGWAGCSASHMAAACRMNGGGHIISVDNGVGGMPHGHLIPEDLREYVTLIPEDGRIWLNHQTPNSIDFLFEDADHSRTLVEELARLALAKVRKDGLYLAHDAMHGFAYVGGGVKINSPVGDEVQTGLRGAGLYFYGYLAEPSDCGLAVCVMPGNKTAEKIVKDQWDVKEYIGSANIESASEPPTPLEGIKVSRVKFEKGIMTEQIEAHPVEPPPLVEFQGIQDIKEGFAPLKPQAPDAKDTSKDIFGAAQRAKHNAELLQAQEKQTDEKPKPRGKGKRKPSTK